MRYVVILTRNNAIIAEFEREEHAEKFCEQWGWNYDGPEGCGPIFYEEI